jgi:N-acetylglutamate synthase-like GNAT family acetyltransferase
MAGPVTFRRYQATDYGAVAALWTRINRESAPAGMETLLERYIAPKVRSELTQFLETFSDTKRNAFWVVESGREIVGSFGIESRSARETELCRMYLDKAYRGPGIVQRMLHHAQAEARALGLKKMILSAADIHGSALSFYRQSGFRQIRTKAAGKTPLGRAPGGLPRFHLEKPL